MKAVVCMVWEGRDEGEKRITIGFIGQACIGHRGDFESSIFSIIERLYRNSQNRIPGKRHSSSRKPDASKIIKKVGRQTFMRRQKQDKRVGICLE